MKTSELDFEAQNTAEKKDNAEEAENEEEEQQTLEPIDGRNMFDVIKDRFF